MTDLHVSYGEVPAVRGIDLDVEEGDTVAVLGRNGAGKTTTLRAIAGTLPAARGTIRLDGEDVTRAGADRRARRGVVLVPEGRRLFPHLTVRENLVVGAHARRLDRRGLRSEIERVTELLDVVRARLDQRAGTLSGGEQQMVAIARALMAQPRLLLVDEPSLGLAPLLVERVYDLFRALRAAGLTIVVVEQYVEVALSVADRAVIVDKGRVALRADASALAESRDLVDAYLSGTEEVA